MLAIGFVCLSVVWVTYVWHCVCMLFLGELCFALGLSVGWVNYVLHWVCLFVHWVNWFWNIWQS